MATIRSPTSSNNTTTDSINMTSSIGSSLASSPTSSSSFNSKHDDIERVAEASDFNFSEANANLHYTQPSNNPRHLDMPPELASFLQSVDELALQKSRSAPLPSKEVIPTLRQPSPRGPTSPQPPQPHPSHPSHSPHSDGPSHVPTMRQPSPRGLNNNNADQAQYVSSNRLPSPRGAQVTSPNRAVSPNPQAYTSPTGRGYGSVRGGSGGTVTSPPSASRPPIPYQSPPPAAIKNAELQKIHQQRQHLLKQLNQLQNIENHLQASDYYEGEEEVVEEPGASYDQLMNSLYPANVSVSPQQFLNAPVDAPEPLYLEEEAPPQEAPQYAQRENHWEQKSMSLKPSQRTPAYRDRFATVSSATRPNVPFNTDTRSNAHIVYAEFFTPAALKQPASQPTSPTGQPPTSFVGSKVQTEQRLVTVASEPAVNMRNPARRSLAGPLPPQNDTMKRSSTYGIARLDPEKDLYQVRREARKPTPGLPKLLLTIHLIDNTNKLVVATEDFRVQDLLYAFAEQLDLKQTDFFYLAIIYDKNPGVYRWLNPQSSLRDEGIQGNSFIVMKIKYFKLPKKLFDPVAVHLYYLQVAHHVLTGSYNAPQSLLMKLGALQFGMTFGAHKPTIHKPGFLEIDQLYKYLPKSLVDSSPSRSVSLRLFAMHSKTAFTPMLESKLIYLDTASNMTTFGMTPFDVMDSIKDPNRTQRVFGVAEDGLFLSKKDLTSSKNQLNFYSYESLISWSVKLRGFEVVVTDPLNSEQVLSIELEPLHPELTHTILNLINGYCLFLAFNDEEKYAHLPVVNDEPLPHPSLFHPPKARPLAPPPPSRISLLRTAYVERCKETKFPENVNFLLKLDQTTDFNETLYVLDVAKSRMNDKQMFHFSRVVAKILALKVDDADIVENISLTTLDFSDNFVGPEAADAVKLILEAAPTIKVLKLRNVGLGEKGTQLLVPVLEKFSGIEHLDVSGNSLGNAGVSSIIKAVRFNKNLREFHTDLNLLNDKISVLFSQLVQTTSTLTVLSLAKNKLGAKGLKELLEGLATNKTIETINLSNNQLGNKYSKGLFDWFLKNPALKKIYLADNKLNAQTGTELASVLQTKGVSVQLVDVTLNDLGTRGSKEIIKALKVNPSLSELHVSGNKISDKGAKLLCEGLELNPSLNKLAIRLCSLGKGALKSIIRVVTPHRQLKFLDLALNEISFSVAEVLGTMIAQNSMLEELHLSNCGMGNRELRPIIDALPRNNKLKKLYLDINKLNKDTLVALAQALSANESLEVLSLRNINTNPKDIDEFLKGLAKARALQKVSLKYNELQESYFTNALRRLPIKIVF